jgi:hypothetical protein
MIWTIACRAIRKRWRTSHPDRNAQFEHIHAAVTAQVARGQPTISVDTKKRELVGRFKNGGQVWRPKGHDAVIGGDMAARRG